jgi:hypothetical protein
LRKKKRYGMRLDRKERMIVKGGLVLLLMSVAALALAAWPVVKPVTVTYTTTVCNAEECDLVEPNCSVDPSQPCAYTYAVSRTEDAVIPRNVRLDGLTFGIIALVIAISFILGALGGSFRGEGPRPDIVYGPPWAGR